ncbi:MAG: alpha/beta hydrolase-fold protein [Ignavibacterium sp.]|jgi:predicted alpha/beta superfamily hydrolase|nr:alpha/beta hydrolase-fold protein [Ignavibacterium sp.]
MKKFLLSLFLLSFFELQPQVKCKFIVNSKLSDENSVICITGNHKLLGEWNPSLVQLLKINDSTWSREFVFEKHQKLEFKFTLGSWDMEALDSAGKKFPNFQMNITNDTTLVFKFNNWGKEHNDFKGKITGSVRYHKNFIGINIPARDIIVWLPPSYDSLKNKRYPVLYMNDGQNIVDPLTSAFGIDWQIDEAADSLIKNHSINEMIIVGIYNSDKRNSEYSNTPLGNAYMNFIVNQLKPFIDVTYRTLDNRENTTICGSSLGGLISFILVWEYDYVFSKAACFSPAFKIDQFDYVTSVENYSGARKDIKLYFYNGGKGVDERLQPGINEMLEALLNRGYVTGKDILYVEDKNADHSESAWAKRVPEMLKFLFPADD